MSRHAHDNTRQISQSAHARYTREPAGSHSSSLPCHCSSSAPSLRWEPTRKSTAPFPPQTCWECQNSTHPWPPPAPPAPPPAAHGPKSPAPTCRHNQSKSGRPHPKDDTPWPAGQKMARHRRCGTPGPVNSHPQGYAAWPWQKVSWIMTLCKITADPAPVNRREHQTPQKPQPVSRRTARPHFTNPAPTRHSRSRRQWLRPQPQMTP